MSQKKSKKAIKLKKSQPLINPFFVNLNKKAKFLFKWKKTDSVIKDHTGQIYYQLKNVKAPQNWSATAIDIAASKYFRRTVKKENSIEALVERIGQGFLSAAGKSQLFTSSKQRSEFVEELKFLIYSQKAAFNSPVWFNLGLSEAYHLTSASEHYALNYKLKKITSIKDAYLRPQISACFIQSLDDSIEGIFELVKTEAKLFKYGSGTGTNFSKLRSKHENLSSGGTSSGLISFLEVLDRSAGAIKSGGTTRRAAKMVCIDLDHPEIEDFVSWKMREEKKAHALIKVGYSADFEGEAFKTIAGQNANNSIRITNEFMQGLESDRPLVLRFRDRTKYKSISSKVLWAKICEAAWSCADPGLQFTDAINRMHTSVKSGRINASNPCSEFMFLDDSACNLASVNLVKFLDEAGKFKTEEFIQCVRLLFIAQETLVSFASYPTEKIAKNSVDYRPLGLGFANLGSLLMRMGLSYDSDTGRAWAGFIASLLSGVAYQTSAEMAQRIGPFAGYKKNKSVMLKVLQKHKSSTLKIDWELLPAEFKQQTLIAWDGALTLGKKFGFRNAQATVVAPTGTIGLIMDCDTTGIEPDYSLIKYKKLSGGGTIKIVNQSVEISLKHLSYQDEEIKKIIDYLMIHETLKGSGLKAQHFSIFSCATGDFFLSPESHLKMMAAVQPFISGAISKTVNLPHDSTLEDVSQIYKKAWEMNLKSVAIYRDGSKFVQPLSGNKNMPKNKFTFPACSECGAETILESGCYRCLNCGTTTACVS